MLKCKSSFNTLIKNCYKLIHYKPKGYPHVDTTTIPTHQCYLHCPAANCFKLLARKRAHCQLAYTTLQRTAPGAQMPTQAQPPAPPAACIAHLSNRRLTMKRQTKILLIGFAYTFGPMVLCYLVSLASAWWLLHYFFKPAVNGNHVVLISPEADKMVLLWVGHRLVYKKMRMPIRYFKNKVLKTQ